MLAHKLISQKLTNLSKKFSFVNAVNNLQTGYIKYIFLLKTAFCVRLVTTPFMGNGIATRMQQATVMPSREQSRRLRVLLSVAI